MVDLSEIKKEITVRRELLKRDKKLLVAIDQKSKRTNSNYLAALIERGALGLNPDGSLKVRPEHLKQAPAISRAAPIHRPVLTPSDYPRLAQANDERDLAFTMSPAWFRLEAEIHRWVGRNSPAQTARAAAVLASFELGIPEPSVVAWQGHEPRARDKLGWVDSNNPDVINIVLTQECRQAVETAAHECKHLEQYRRYPNLSHDQRENDAGTFGREFEMRVFATRDLGAERYAV